MATLAKVHLIYDWKYRIYGEHHKRNFEYPVTLEGRCLQTVTYDTSKTREEQNAEIKQQLRKFIIEEYRAKAMEEWDRPETERLWKEAFQFTNIREATRWSDLEDFTLY